jgi:hypothetical protein
MRLNEGVRRFHIFLGDHKTSLLPPDTRKVLQWSVHPVVVLTLMPKSYHAVFCRLLTVLWCGLLAPQAEQVMMSSKSTEKLLNHRRSHVSYVCCFFNMFNLCKNVFYVLVFLLLYFFRGSLHILSFLYMYIYEPITLRWIQVIFIIWYRAKI